MNNRRAYEEVTIAHGDHAVMLRPSLRAATILEERFGFPALFRALDDFNLTIISEIILTLSTSRQDAAAFLSSVPGRPLLPFFLTVRAPLAELVSMLTPAPDPSHSDFGGKVIPFAQVYRTLFRIATGALGWPPEAAWNATPTEIDQAIIGKPGLAPNGPDPEQAERNAAAGLDPEFDRAGLHALKAFGRKA